MPNAVAPKEKLPRLRNPSQKIQSRTDLSEHEKYLEEQMGEFYDDPEAFVDTVFPWGVEGTDLAGFDGPRDWQRKILQDIGDEVRERNFNGVDAVDPIQMATASGHGIGKSALTAWLILWIMSTRRNAKGCVTANTSDQLKTKTWAEVGKWHKMCTVGHWFIYNSSKGNMNLSHVKNPESWRCDAQTCREENSESFAGLHSVSSTPFYIFDEASAVPDIIWEVSDGGLTDGEPMRFVWGNPTRNKGRFFECFNRYRHRWITNQIDSRTVPGTNHSLHKEWEEDFGEDSDFFRVRVRGIFPRGGAFQLIDGDIVEACMKRDPIEDKLAPLVLSVDVARFGDDMSVITTRIGRDAQSFPQQCFRGLDNEQLADKIVETVNYFQALGRPVDLLPIDGDGVGGGVIDACKRRGLEDIVYEIHNNAAVEGTEYGNVRMYCYGEMLKWMKSGGCIEQHPDLRTDLTGIEYWYDVHNQKRLEKKEDAKNLRGMASPDRGDSLAFGFVVPVLERKDRLLSAIQATRVMREKRKRKGKKKYDPHRNLRV